MTSETPSSRRQRRKTTPEPGVSEQAAIPVPEVKPEVRPATAMPAKAPASPGPRSVGLASAWPGGIRVNTAPSGSIYFWRRPGDIVQVLETDLPHLLAKNRTGPVGCCGSGGPRIYFVLA
jgi:hypothetical protein